MKKYMSFVVCCCLLLFAAPLRAAQEVAAEDVKGTAHEDDLISLSFSNVRLSNVISLFVHMSAFSIACDPEIIPDTRASVDVTDTPWKTLIEDVLKKHDLVLTKLGSSGYRIAAASARRAAGRAGVDWQGAMRENIRLRQIISRGSENIALLDNFGLVESGSVISAPFGAHVYAWQVSVSTNAISLKPDTVKELRPDPGPEAEEVDSPLEKSLAQNDAPTPAAAPRATTARASSAAAGDMTRPANN